MRDLHALAVVATHAQLLADRMIQDKQLVAGDLA